MLTVIGLGNPGAAYEKTRHNVGFMLLDNIFDGRFGDKVSFSPEGLYLTNFHFGSEAKFKRKSPLYMAVEGEVEGNRFTFVKPMTFMNNSGRALTSLRGSGVVTELSEILIVVDDVDLESGRIRLRLRGSAGGHNGLISVINHLGTDEFARLRIGVGPRPNGDEMVDYVLGEFQADEMKILDKSLEKAAYVVGAWISGGFEKANNILERL